MKDLELLGDASLGVPRGPAGLLGQRVNSKINCYCVNFSLYNMAPFAPLLNASGWATSGDEYYVSLGQRIDDLSKSGITISSRGVNHAAYQKSLAHEIGHVLIQKGEEHNVDGAPLSEEYLMCPVGQGTKIHPKQYISALDLDGNKISQVPPRSVTPVITEE